MNNTSPISIIVPVHNGQDTLVTCIENLLKQTKIADEIIFVDNNSTDDTKTILFKYIERFPTIKYIFEPRKGRAFARNAGIRIVSNPIIAMIDVDCTPDCDWLAKLTEPIIKNRVNITTGSQRPRSARFWSTMIQSADEKHYAAHRKNNVTTLVDTKNCAFETQLIKRYMFNELCGNCEDFELSLRLRDKEEIFFVENAVVMHTHKETLSSFARLSFDRGFWVKRIYMYYRDDNRFSHEITFENFKQGSFLKYFYLLLIEFIKKPFSEALFISIAGVAWRAGSYYEILRREPLYKKRAYNKKSISKLIKRFPKTFPYYKKPTISIIIPVYNQVRYTIQCLESIRLYTDIPYEVIVIDNNSIDATQQFLQSLNNVVLIKNDYNKGFGIASNQGVKRARGSYLLFLNNDTVVTRGWLQPMLDEIQHNTYVGAVVPKILNFDNTLQASGCVRSANGWFEARGKNKSSKLYNVVEEIDAFYATCVLIPRTVFEGAAGFDERFTPAYHEDVDLCLKLKKAGYAFIYSPHSKIFHKEAASTITEERLKLLDKNFTLLKERWSAWLQSYYASRVSNAALISIVVPAFNSAYSLKNCIDALLKQTIKNFELIIVDNHSTDATASIIHEYAAIDARIRYVFESRKSRGAARNAGIKKAKGDVIAMIDSDCVAPQDWLAMITGPIKMGLEKVVMGSEQPRIVTPLTKLIQKRNAAYLTSYRSPKYIGILDTKNVAFHASVFNKLRFDDYQANSEDFDFSLQLINRFLIYYRPDIAVQHVHHVSLVNWLQKTYDRAFWTARLLTKYPEPTNLQAHPILQASKQSRSFLAFLLPSLRHSVRYPTIEHWFDFVTNVAWSLGTKKALCKKSNAIPYAITQETN